MKWRRRSFPRWATHILARGGKFSCGMPHFASSNQSPVPRPERPERGLSGSGVGRRGPCAPQRRPAAIDAGQSSSPRGFPGLASLHSRGSLLKGARSCTTRNSPRLGKLRALIGSVWLHEKLGPGSTSLDKCGVRKTDQKWKAFDSPGKQGLFYRFKIVEPRGLKIMTL